MPKKILPGGCLVVFFAVLLLGFSGWGEASRFSLFALDVQIPYREGQSLGEVRKIAIAKGLQQAVEEATYRIIPDQGLEATYQTLKHSIFERAQKFVTQYKILGEKQFPGTFNLSLQVTVDTVLLRKALLKTGVLKAGEREAVSTVPVTLEIRELVDGKTLMELWNFFRQREDLVEHFELHSAQHGTFTFTFVPLQPMKEIVSQILYHARISHGTFEVIEQEKDKIILAYRMEKPS